MSFFRMLDVMLCIADQVSTSTHKHSFRQYPRVVYCCLHTSAYYECAATNLLMFDIPSLTQMYYKYADAHLIIDML